MRIMLTAACSLALCATASAFPACLPEDDAGLCRLAKEAYEDNPSFKALHDATPETERTRAGRLTQRRTEAMARLAALPQPSWRDLWNAGYVAAYGTTPEALLIAHAIAIRTLSLAPDEADARFLVAMTFDSVAKAYADQQVYGLQKWYALNPSNGEVQYGCLPHMVEGLPSSVTRDFHVQNHGLKPCAPGQGPR